MVRVHIPPALRQRTRGERAVESEGASVRAVIDTLSQGYPDLRFNLLLETGDLRPYINLFVEGEDIRFLQGLDTPVPPNATIHIFHSVAGG